MAILPIRTFPDPILKRTCQEVGAIGNREIQDLIDDMIETMFAAPGAGLAAPQVGEPLRIIVVNLADEHNPKRALAMINPEITESDGDIEICEEGCLSVPDYLADIKRCTHVRVKYWDRSGKLHEIDGHNYLARVFQHEIDHLNGILFFEYLGRVKRDLVRRRLIKGAKRKVQD